MHSRAELVSSVYHETTEGVRVTVEPNPLPENSAPERNIYAFSYTITLENLGTRTVQLIERHWIIRSAGVQTGEVKGPGVVGLQPVLAPGQAFQYSSGAVIPDPVGSMEGSYLFRVIEGEEFSVTIPRFDLLYGLMVH